jgi:hypothetical protein
MPPQRTVLGSIDPNRTRGKDLSPYLRGKLVGAANAGQLHTSIQAEYRVSRKALRGTIAQDYARPDSVSAKKPGCSSIYSIRDERMILRNLRLFPKSTFDERR